MNYFFKKKKQAGIKPTNNNPFRIITCDHEEAETLHFQGIRIPANNGNPLNRFHISIKYI